MVVFRGSVSLILVCITFFVCYSLDLKEISFAETRFLFLFLDFFFHDIANERLVQLTLNLTCLPK